MLKITFSTNDTNEDDDSNNVEERNARFFEGCTDLHGKNINVLHLACQEGLTQTVEYILTEDPKQINFKSASGWTPFMTACEAGYTDVIQKILDKVDDKTRLQLFDFVCESGSAIHAAVTGQKPLETVKFLVEKLEEIAVDEGETDYVEKVLNKKDLSHVHPLFLSVFSGNYDVTKFLIDSGSDPMASYDHNGATILHICGERGYNEITTLICKQAPQMMFEQDEEGQTPLHVVCDWDYLDVLKTFCDTIDGHMAKVNGDDQNFEPTADDSDDSNASDEKEQRPLRSNAAQS